MIRGALVALLRLEPDIDVVAELDRGDTIVETALRAAFTRSELETLVRESGLERTEISEPDEHHLLIERRGESDPNSWIKAREQYM